MGQQQLLLLVLAVVLVGIAVVASWPFINRAVQQDDSDGLLDRAMSIATYAVQWKSTMDPFNGGNASYAALKEGGVARLSMDAENARGFFAITDATDETLEITGVSRRYPKNGVRVWVRQYAIDSSRVVYDGSIALE